MSFAVFLDRDGVLNTAAAPGEYITTPHQLELLPGTADALSALRGRGFKLVVVTNQRGVALELMTGEELGRVHDELRRQLGEQGVTLDLILSCPHGLDDGCLCRKPLPGMIFQATEALGIDLSGSWMVGDNTTDIDAGRAAGVRTVRVATDGRGKPATEGDAEHTCRDLGEAAVYILSGSPL